MKNPLAIGSIIGAAAASLVLGASMAMMATQIHPVAAATQDPDPVTKTVVMRATVANGWATAVFTDPTGTESKTLSGSLSDADFAETVVQVPVGGTVTLTVTPTQSDENETGEPVMVTCGVYTSKAGGVGDQIAKHKSSGTGMTTACTYTNS